MTTLTRLVEVRTKILKENDVHARAFRARCADAGVFVVCLVSSPGSGKTELLERTLAALAGEHRVAALVGDLATDNDARRLARSGVPVRQIVTNTVCHLEAAMVTDALAGWDLDALDYLFIENVGNLVCPATYDLGESVRAVLFATTEGEDKPRKYPTIFNTADIAVITKSDLAGAVGFDGAAARASVQSVRPGMPVFETSARTGAGVGGWIEELSRRRSEAVGRTPPQRKGTPCPVQ
jgi:hydrogenase nickel incorporation protein HypB